MGQKLSLTDARGYRAEMRYDAFDRQSHWIFPSKTAPGAADPADYEQYGYDPNGNRVWMRKRDGGVFLYTYDTLNRMVIKETPGNLANVRYGYDLRGLQTVAWFTGNDWSVSNVWDGFGRLTSTSTNMGNFSRTVSHKYDRDGRDVELTFPDGQKFWTSRDGLGRTGGIFPGALGSSSPFMVGFAYNWASQLYYFARGSGDVSAFGYDGPGRIAMIEDGFGGGIGNSRSDFAYNPAGQLGSESRTNDAYAWTGSVAVSRNYAANGQNQYSGTVSNGSANAAFTYDANGNLKSDGTTTFAYDSENRLLSASGAKNATLSYDPLGRLFQIWSPATGVTQFLHDGDELVAEYNGSGTMLRRYVHGNGSDDPLFWYEGPGFDQPRFPHTNRQGSITATAGPGGTPLWINTYGEYGIPGANNQGRFQYTGQAWIPELGMYYYKARFYSPTLGRFLQTDPIGYDDQINLYAYVGNDPVNKLDSTGTSTEGENGREATKRPKVEYRITIAVDRGKGSESSVGKGSGHAWVKLERVVDGRVVAATTRGLWKDGYAPNNGKGNDIRQDIELKRDASISRSATISERAFRAVLADSRRDVTYSETSNNCTDFAARAWRIGTNQSLATSSWWTFGVSTPATLGGSLSQRR